MNLKALVAASIGGLLLASNAEPRLPAGWSRQASLEGDRACRAGIDLGLREGGRRLLTIDCERNHDGYVSVTQTIAADDYRGKRMRLAARLKTDKVRGWTGLTMRVSGADQRVLSFDDMSTRPLRGSQDWREVAVILDVDPANERVMLVNSETPEDAESWVASVADAFQRHCIYFFAEFVDDIDQEWEPTRWWRGRGHSSRPARARRRRPPSPGGSAGCRRSG